VVAMEPEVVALETEAMQPCLALPRHHPQHYDMLVTTCETKRYMSNPLTKGMQNRVSEQMYSQFSSTPRIRFITRRWW